MKKLQELIRLVENSDKNPVDSREVVKLCWEAHQEFNATMTEFGDLPAFSPQQWNSIPESIRRGMYAAWIYQMFQTARGATAMVVMGTPPLPEEDPMPDGLSSFDFDD
jgi:hypothetical protein